MRWFLYSSNWGRDGQGNGEEVKVKYTTIILIPAKAGQRGESNMDSFKKKKKERKNTSIIVSLHISPPRPKVTGISTTFQKKGKSRIASRWKDRYTIKRVLTSMRCVDTVIYKHIFHLFPSQCLKGKKKKKKPFTSNHSLLKYSGKKKKRFSLEKGGGEEGTSEEKKKNYS